MLSPLAHLWCADKEVEGYYDDGMRVPEDIALMWTDDKYVYMRY